MTPLLKATVVSLGLCVAATTAHATVVDFTDPSALSVAGSTITGTGFSSLTASGGAFNIAEVGPGAIGPLSGLRDGVGIGDDEISFPGEVVTLAFDSAVTLTSLYLLDFFSGERMTISNGTDTVEFMSAAVPGDTIGFFTGVTGLVGSIFTLTAGQTDDADSINGDFALAGVEIAAVPLPATLLLLGGALLGAFGLSRRRRTLSAPS